MTERPWTQRLLEIGGRRVPFLWWSVLRMALGGRTLLKTWQVGDGREEALAQYVVANTRPGDLDDAIRTVDEFCYTRKVMMNVADIGGADMVAYNPHTGQYYTGSRNMPGGPVLGVIDAKSNALVQKVALGGGNPHSVAVNDANNHVFVPQSSKGGGCGCVLVFAPE